MVVIYCQPFDGWLHCSTETPVSLVKKLTDIRVEEGSLVPMECEFSRQNVEVKWLKVKNNPQPSVLPPENKAILHLYGLAATRGPPTTCGPPDLRGDSFKFKALKKAAQGIVFFC